MNTEKNQNGSIDESTFAHWGDTKQTMKKKALQIFAEMLKQSREQTAYSQDGSRGQAEAYHNALLESLK